jgi:hypothetical protein
MRCVGRWFVGLLLVSFIGGCPASDDGDGDGVTGNSTLSSVSNEDGPEPMTCEQLGGMCSCSGACDEGQMPEPNGTCPQPPDESGACGQGCCVPVTGTTAGSTMGSTAGSTAGTVGTADATADTSAPVCDCTTLPVCNTPDDEDCGGQYPEAHCCDDQGEAMTCTCVDPCGGGFPCCALAPGCA